jgi:nicotinamide-nucleotide amidase
MQGEIIIIGNELISGRVCDINSSFLAARLSSHGLDISSVSVIGDDAERIAGVLHQAVERSNFVIVCGGLGPTEDDITIRVAADVFNLPLIEDQSLIAAIKKALKKWGVPWAEAYGKMALVPKGAQVLDPNQACGFYLNHDQVPVFFLPGVPEEVRLLAEQKVLPYLLERVEAHTVIVQKLFKVFGIQEARIGELLRGLESEEPGAQVGFYPTFPETHVTITVRAADREAAEHILGRLEAEVDRRLGAYVLAKDGHSLEGSIGGLLRQRGLRLAVPWPNRAPAG